jgi:hypothetical protein
MRRAGVSAILLLLAAAGGAAAQPRVGVVVGLSPNPEPNGARAARVQVQDLLADPRWAQALERAFPIRLEYRLEIWRSREGWMDNFQRAAEWSTIIQRQPLEDQYRVTRIFLAGPQEYRFATLEELDGWIRQVNQVEALPTGTGTFYYTVTVRITALSDDDMEELERFLAGEPDSQLRPNRSPLGRSVRRFLLRMAGLPWEELYARSPTFTVQRR